MIDPLFMLQPATMVSFPDVATGLDGLVFNRSQWSHFQASHCILLISQLCSIPKRVPGSFINSRGAGWQVFKTCHQKRSYVSINTGVEGKIFFAARVYNTRVYSKDGAR